LFVELADDLGRRVLRRPHAPPTARLVVRHALTHCRDVLPRLRARRGGQCDRLQPTTPDIPTRSDNHGQVDRRLATDHTLQRRPTERWMWRRPAPTTRLVDHIDAGHQLELLA